MIEPKDASTCDERRVKNKLNPLTPQKERRNTNNEYTRYKTLAIRHVFCCQFDADGRAVH